MFHAYYDEYCYLPVHLYEGKSGKLITTLLRPGRRMRGREAAAILKRVLDHLIMVWPKTKITLRGDSHFSTPEVHDLCDGYGIDFILGQAINNKLKALGEPLMELAAALAEQTDEPVRLFDRFEYQAKSCPPTAPDYLQGRDHARQSQPALRGDQHPQPHPRVSV